MIKMKRLNLINIFFVCLLAVSLFICGCSVYPDQPDGIGTVSVQDNESLANPDGIGTVSMQDNESLANPVGIDEVPVHDNELVVKPNSDPSLGEQNDNDSSPREVIKDDFEDITISGDGSFLIEECKIRKLEDKTIMILSKYCGHCKQTLPLFEEACEEKGISPIILDISIPEQRDQMESYGINIQYIPTFIFGCKYYVGALNEEEYVSSLERFLEEQ